VIIWDRGRWYPEGDPHKDHEKGHLTFVLDGEKLKGRWHLVRMHKRNNERQDPWQDMARVRQTLPDAR
jgi:bifunctional non-homologous end joining protein LigD